jgi:multidrug efflux pump subunit AcrA (membrane-fusion protein)
MFLKKKAEPGEGPAKGPKLRFGGKKLTRKRIVLLCVLVIVLIGAVYGLVRLFFADDEAVALTDVTTYGALTKTIEGTGTVLPSDSQIVTAASKAEILNVYVAAGGRRQGGRPHLSAGRLRGG